LINNGLQGLSTPSQFNFGIDLKCGADNDCRSDNIADKSYVLAKKKFR